MRLYEKIIAYSALVVSLVSAAGCGLYLSKGPAEAEPKREEKSPYSASIDGFGTTKVFPVRSKFLNSKDLGTDGIQAARSSVTTADMDGDGDLDVIVANSFGEINVLENKIPQKK